MITNDLVVSARYLAYGCPPTLVSGSLLTEMLIGKTIGEVLKITKANLVEGLGGLPSRKHHAAALAIEALRSALKDLR